MFIVRVIRIPKKGYFGDFWRSLFKKLKPLRSKRILQKCNPCCDSSWPTKTFDETKLLGISATDEYKWDSFINLLCNRRDISSDSQNHIRLKPYHLTCQNRKTVKLTFSISVFDDDVPTLDVSKVAQARAQILYWTFLGVTFSDKPPESDMRQAVLDELMRLARG